MPGPTQLKALNGIVLYFVWDEPNSVCSSVNGVCFDLELYDSEIVENIRAGHVENDRRVSRHPEDIDVGVIVRISESPIELVTRDIESWAALPCRLGLIICRNAITPCSVRGSIREESVYRGKRCYDQDS